MITIPQALELAVKHHQAGQLEQAEQIYRQILQVDPQQIDALHLLGLTASQLGRNDQAVDYLSRTLELNPNFAEAHYNLGIVLKAQGKTEEAMAHYRQALLLKPEYAEAHNNLGEALRQQGKLEEALASLREALHLRPNFAEAHNNLGLLLQEQGQLEEAAVSLRQAVRFEPQNAKTHSNLGMVLKAQGHLEDAAASLRQALFLKPDSAEWHNALATLLKEQGKLEGAAASFRQALLLKPDCAEWHNALGTVLKEQGKLAEAAASFQWALHLDPDFSEAHNNIGIVFMEQGQLAAAEASLRQALLLKPDSAEAHINLGIVLVDQGSLEEAVAGYDQALRLKPDCPEAHNNLGNALKEQWKLEEAMARYDQAIRLKPDFAEAHNGLGAALAAAGKLNDAVASYDQALRLKPDLPEAHLNRAQAWLLMGDFEHGWPEYEWRWQSKDLAPQRVSQLLWDGSDLQGKTILLHAEQGLGDTLQFIRYAPLVKQRGATVIVNCRQTLAPLLRTCAGIDRLVADGAEPPPFDVQAPLLSLPGLFKTTLASLPANVPYLFADAELIDRWRTELRGVAGLKVGIAWQGNPGHRGDRHRSVRLERFAALARVPGVTLVSLQKGHGSEQLAALPDRHLIVDLGSRLDEAAGTFMDTAAALASLDLVITVDTALAHLAGALGVPVWLALSFAPDWRWLTDREDTPWYPTMRLFRQQEPGNWDHVFEGIARALHERSCGGAGAGMTAGLPPPAAEDIPAAAIPKVLAQALRHHQVGELQKAEQLYLEVLQIDPADFEARHRLGLLAYQTGRNAMALGYLRQAVRLRPDSAPAHYDLGAVLQASGQLEEAVASYQQSLLLDPNCAQGYNNLGGALMMLGRPEEALVSLRRAVQLNQSCAEAHNSLGVVLQERGQLAEALTCYRQALRVKPDFPEGHNNLGAVLLKRGQLEEALASCRQAVSLRPHYAGAHCNLGNVLRQCGRLEEALACYRQAVVLNPNFAEAHCNLGNILSERGQLEEAVTSCRQAIRLKPDYAEAHNSLGLVLKEQGKLDEAVASHRQALRVRPDYAEAHNNLGNALGEQGRLDEALASYQEALRLQPDYAEPHVGRAIAWLLMGDFERGWPEYEWRWRPKNMTMPPYAQPRWDGGDLAGRTILLHAEQGLGDTLQFIRYAPLLKRRGATVLVACQPALLGLLAACPGIDGLQPAGAPRSPVDVHAPLLSLPGLCGTTLDAIPAEVPYLAAEPTLAERWGRELASVPGLRVGIAWQGNPAHKGDRRRSVRLERFAELARVSGVTLVSLQKGHGSEQLAALPDRDLIIDLGTRLDEAAGPFMDTAAVLASLDLVITVDTALAHLAGALGVPVWVALPLAPDWRWLMDRADTPWYPTMRLFRQKEAGKWDDVFDRLASALQQRARDGAGMRAVPPPRAAADSPAADVPEMLALALRHHQAGELRQAEQLCRQVLQIDPAHFDALHLLSLFAHQTGRNDLAVDYLRQALRVRPDAAEAHKNLGVALMELGRLEEAVASHQQALRLQPHYAEAHDNLAVALVEMGRLEEAVASHQEALRLQPHYAEAHDNLGVALAELGRLEQAVASHEQALGLKANSPTMHKNLAIAWLLMGDFERGWPEYEWRWKCKEASAPAYRQPLWDGSDLHGKTILLHAEQGLGDTLHFVRYACLVKQRGATVLLKCQKPLVRLLRTCAGIDHLAGSEAELPPFDVHAPLLSLPGFFRTSLAAVPADVPYLFADADLLNHWRGELSRVEGFKIGICWQGNPAHKSDRRRSIPLTQFALLLRLEGVQLVSLQKDHGSEQLAALPDRHRIIDLGNRLDEAAGAFMDTAAALASLDLVITADTALAHLAGALGVPVWVALPFAPDWRWLRDRADTPWYPTMRLFRQKEPGNWDDVFDRLARALEARGLRHRDEGRDPPAHGRACLRGGGPGSTGAAAPPGRRAGPVINGTQTINESSGQLDTVNSVTYRYLRGRCPAYGCREGGT